MSEEQEKYLTDDIAQLRADKQFLSKEVAKYISHSARWRGYAEKAHNALGVAKAELAEIKKLSQSLLDQMNSTYENREYSTAWTLYATHMGDYKKNGGKQWTEQQDALADYLSVHPEKP
jgi:hypothetical protein